MDLRPLHEIEHGKFLAENQTESLWGWGTPAGKQRAKRRANLIAQGANLSSKSCVLEVGCGSGMFTEMFADSGAQILAVDISSNLLEKAKKRGLPTNQVQFLERRFEECALDGPFDAVIGSSVLHHLDLNLAFPMIFKLLKPGGVMSFAEPNLLNPQIFLERRFRQWFPFVSVDETAFIPWRLRHDLIKAGFDNITITPFDWLHPATPIKLIKYIKTIGLFLEKTPFFKNFSGSLYIKALRPMR